MPLVRIDLRAGKSAAHRKAIADGVHRALVEAVDIPAADRFQIITEHAADGLIYDPSYPGIQRSDEVVFIQIAWRRGRSVEKKKALYRRIAELLAVDPGLRKQDVFVGLMENDAPDWSFGDGEAQYAK